MQVIYIYFSFVCAFKLLSFFCFVVRVICATNKTCYCANFTERVNNVFKKKLRLSTSVPQLKSMASAILVCGNQIDMHERNAL